MDCFATPGDTSGDTGAIGDVRPSLSPSLSGNGDNFDGLCGEREYIGSRHCEHQKMGSLAHV